jgi:hypothetical protein
VAEQLDRAPHHEQANAQTIGACRIEPLESIKNLWQVLGGNPHARVVDIDAYVLAEPSIPSSSREQAPTAIGGLAHMDV